MDACRVVLRCCAPSHLSQEASCSSLPSWSEGSTYHWKCIGFVQQESVLDVLAVGENVWYVLPLLNQ